MLQRSMIATAAAAALAGTVLGAVPANAAGQDGVSDSGELIFAYYTDMRGSKADLAVAKSDLNCCVFLTKGDGKGVVVKNHAESAVNFRAAAARVYFNSNYMGVNDYIPGGYSLNLTNTKNENASFKWV